MALTEASVQICLKATKGSIVHSLESYELAACYPINYISPSKFSDSNTET